MATDKPRFSISMDEETLKEVEDYRYKNRISTQSKAIVSLVKIGLAKIAIEETPHSEMVIYQKLTPMEAGVLERFRTLDSRGKATVDMAIDGQKRALAEKSEHIGRHEFNLADILEKDRILDQKEKEYLSEKHQEDCGNNTIPSDT